MNKGKHESYEGRGGRKPKLAVAVASREDGSCKRGWRESGRVGWPWLVMTGLKM